MNTPSNTSQSNAPAVPVAARLLDVEAVADLPVLFAKLQRLRVAEFLDRQYPTHHLWKGELTFGEVVCVWLLFILSEGDHCLSHLQPWAGLNQRLLQDLLGKTVHPLDFHDDRLADVLDSLAQLESWRSFEADLNGHTLRVYDLETSLVRYDSTTASCYHKALEEHGLIQFGHSKDRDDLPQVKVALAVLDPLGMPVSITVVPGNAADDPLYVPEIKRVQQALGAGGKTHVGDCKMASLDTRAFVADSGDYYLCPLPERQLSREQRRLLLQQLWQGKQTLQQVYRPAAQVGGEAELVAEGFAVEVSLQAESDGRVVCWKEKRWLVRSLAYAGAQAEALERRLSRARQRLEELGQRKRGKRRLNAAQMQEAAEAIVAEERVQGLLRFSVQSTVKKRRVRCYGDRPERTVREEEHSVAVSVAAEAVEQAKREMGWQVYGTNRVATTLAEAVWAYRGQYHIEDDWSRLKGRSLGLTPVYLADEQRLLGLVLLLSVGLRVLTLLEHVLRKRLKQGGEKVKGLYPGQEGRQTDRPSAELLLQAFSNISRVVVEIAGQVVTFLTPLTALQQRLLQLWDFPSDLYSRLATHLAKSLQT